MNALQRMCEENGGTLPAYAWLGAYRILYVASDGESFCAACANGENGSRARLVDGPDDAPCDGWRIDGSAIVEGYPETTETCCHCGKVIAYSEEDEPKEATS